MDGLSPPKALQNGPSLWHGLGANANDLYDLGVFLRDAIDPMHTTLIGPQAPMRELTYERMHCPAWCDIVAIEAQAQVDLEGLTSHDARLAAWFNQVHPTLHETRIVHLGFSQGGAMATTYAHHHGAEALILLSAYWPNKAWRPTCPILWQHGLNDPILPFAWAQQMQRDLNLANLTFEAYAAEHHVDPAQRCHQDWLNTHGLTCTAS